MSGATLFVCTTCRRRTGDAEDAFETPGPALVEALTAALAGDPIPVRPVECLAVCKRPATVAFTAEGKWTYTVGDLDERLHVDELAAMARAYAASENGIVAWRERPACVRKGVVSRVPPVAFVQPAREAAE